MPVGADYSYGISGSVVDDAGDVYANATYYTDPTNLPNINGDLSAAGCTEWPNRSGPTLTGSMHASFIFTWYTTSQPIANFSGGTGNQLFVRQLSPATGYWIGSDGSGHDCYYTSAETALPSGTSAAAINNLGEVLIRNNSSSPPYSIANAASSTTNFTIGWADTAHSTWSWNNSHTIMTESTVWQPPSAAELATNAASPGHAYNLNTVVPTGWSGVNASAINDSGAIVGTATYTQQSPSDPIAAGSHGVMLFPAGISVDANRDGTIVMANDANNPANVDPVTGAPLQVDTTSQAHPFRFWINSFDERNEQDNIDSSYQDGSSTTIADQRDLENFTRLWIYNNVSSGFFGSVKVQIGLKWRSVTGTPSIRLFTAVESDGGTQYLSSSGFASGQVGPDGNAITDKNGLQIVAPIYGAADFIFADGPDNSYSITNNERHYLFEGVGVGSGELVPVYLDSTGKEIGEGPGVWLDLKNIKTMYKSSDADQFVQAWDESQQAIVFVHGWNMTADGSRTYAEDMFKRLWQRGYKGRFCYFRWNTEYGPLSNDFNLSEIETDINSYLADYNGSENTAWSSGAALESFIGTAVPSGYSKNLVTHSMGNIVGGSALLSGLSVAHYALLNAAVPSCCYDTSQDRQQSQSTRAYTFAGNVINVTLWGNLTPDNDPDSATQALAYRGRLASYGVNHLFSFYLQNDAATEYAWEFNNARFKPVSVGSDPSYYYDRNANPGQKLFKVTGTTAEVSYLTNSLEAMPNADQSWSKAAGADAGTGGAITGKLDMDAQYGFGTIHSAEFNFDIQAVGAFYYDLLNTLGIPQTSLDSLHTSTE